MKAHVVKGYVLQLFFLLAAQFCKAVAGTADWAIVRLLAFPPCGFVLRPFGQLVLWFRHESCIRRGDGEGNRVAKGSITGLNCNFATNGFSLTSSYVNGLGGEQLTEMKASGAWDHSNVYAGGALLATYSGTDTYFAFNDWLGTKRAELRVSDGCLETYASLPFGDKLTQRGTAQMLPNSTLPGRFGMRSRGTITSALAIMPRQWAGS